VRKRYAAPNNPLYYVDCDMGSQLFVALGEMLGWDIRLAEIPKHNFVRWHLSQSEAVNWDWSDCVSRNDDAYRARVPASDEIAPQGRPENQATRSVSASLEGLKAALDDPHHRGTTATPGSRA
jgi:hypothetical protein